MANDVSSTRTSTGPAGPAGASPVAGTPRPWRSWRLIAVLAVVASGVAGAVVQHAVDQHKAAPPHLNPRPWLMFWAAR
jgi:hypothetical protein